MVFLVLSCGWFVNNILYRRIKEMLHAVIMAGGGGTRFWPLSRQNFPKQLLKISGDKTMIQATVERLAPIADSKHILIVTGAAHAEEIKRQLPDIPDENIIKEPVGRNTAPCVALAAHIIANRDPDGVMAIFPADHLIAKPEELIGSIEKITARIETDPQLLATIGITPSYPETGYGYIKKGSGDGNIFSVDEFCEKPDTETAKRYVDDGGYLWNAGMFFWKVSTILAEFDRHMPELANTIKPIAESIPSNRFDETMDKTYPTLPAQSIDYGIMEKAGGEGRVLVAECDPGWNDVGSWRSLYDIIPSGKDRNRSIGDLVAIDSAGVYSHSDKKLVAVVGVDDIIVVETDDAILICNKERAQDVRKITETLKNQGRTELL